MSNFPIRVPTLKIYRGDSFSQSFVFKDSLTGEVKDLVTEGWTNWLAQWRPNVDSDKFLSFTVSTTQANEGMISIQLSSEESELFKSGVWDLQATQNLIVRTWLMGKVDVARDVTRV